MMYFSTTSSGVFLVIPESSTSKGSKVLAFACSFEDIFFSDAEIAKCVFFSQPIALKSGAHSMSTEKSGSWQII